MHSVPVEAGGEFIVHEGYVYMGSRYGNKNTLHVIDVHAPKTAKLVSTMRFKRAIGSLAVRGTTLYASESQRAINLISLENPATPDYFDCALALGKTVYEFGFVGDFLVAALNWDGIGIMDVSVPNKAQWVDTLKLEEGYIEHLAVVRDRIFATCASGGIAVFEIQEAKLVQIASPKGDDFNASSVFVVGEHLWFIGTPEGKETHIYVIDPNKVDEVLVSFELDVSAPSTLIDIADGVAVGWNGYTCIGYAPSQAWARNLFKQHETDEDKVYVETPCDRNALSEAEIEEIEMLSIMCMDDTSCVVREGDFILAAQGDTLNIYSIEEASLLAKR
ncbi:MAG: hypothetical protein JKY56_13570 [Kofleriaceae bacterium]|nr:hypothetical protein [Kofleriaceae bacterium]